MSWLASCSDGGPEAGKDWDGEGDTAEEAPKVEEVYTAMCAQLPAPRWLHSMVWVTLPEPTPILTWVDEDGEGVGGGAMVERVLQRGFVVQGGQAWSAAAEGEGDLLADLWWFDVSNLGTGSCPWIELNPDTGHPVAGASAAWDETANLLYILGGFVGGGDRQTTDDVFTIDLADPSDALIDDIDPLPAVTYVGTDLGDGEGGGAGIPKPQCLASTYDTVMPCLDPDQAADWVLDVCCPCTGDTGGPCCNEHNCCTTANTFPSSYFFIETFDPCDQETNPCTGGGQYDGHVDLDTDFNYLFTACEDDPYCQEADGVIEVETEVQGLAEAVAAYVPGRGIINVGGVTGIETCSGCAWETLFGFDLSDTPHLLGGSADPWIELSGPSAGNVATAQRPSGVTDPGTYGRRGAGGAPLDIAWDRTTWTSSSSDEIVALVGGTLHQGAGRGAEHTVECAPEAEWCNYVCTSFEGAWSALGPLYGDGVAGRVTGEDLLVFGNDEGWVKSGLDFGGRVHPAVSNFGAHQILVVGGDTSDGPSAEVFMINPGDANIIAYTEVGTQGERVGARAVFDPVTKTGYVFGGDATSSTYTIRTGDSLEDGENLDWDAAMGDDVAVTITDRQDIGKWQTSIDFTLAGECSGDCYLEDLKLEIPTVTASELATLEITVTTESGYAATLPAWESSVGALASEATVRLPEPLTNGRSLSVHAEFFRLANGAPSLAFCGGILLPAGSVCRAPFGADTPATPEDERGTAWMVPGFPAWPVEATGAGADVTTTWGLPATKVGIAPGTIDSTHTVFGPFTGIVNASYFPVAMRGVSLTQVVTGGGTHGLQIWGDTRFSTGDADLAYISTTSGEVSPAGDLAWLEDRLGPIQGGTYNVIYRRAAVPTEQAVGTAWAGMVHVVAAESNGVALFKATPRTTTVHELVHAWNSNWHGGGEVWAVSAEWAKEGLPTLVEAWREPTESTTWMIGGQRDNQEQLYPVAVDIGRRACAYGTGLWELEGGSGGVAAPVAYEHGAYTIAQLYYLYLAHGGTDGDWWAAWRALFESEAGTRDATTMEAFLSTTLGLTGAYDDYVGPLHVGTPMLAWSLDRTVDSGAPWGVRDRMYIQQVQDQKYTMAHGCARDATYVDEAPYFMGCSPADASVAGTIDDCDVNETTVLNPTPRITDALNIYLSLDSSSTTSPYPAKMGLFGNDALLPESVPLAGVNDALRMRWFVVCAPGDTTGVCETDADADGFVLEGDCNDDNDTITDPSLVNLNGALTGDDAALLVDFNCDGWM